MADDEPTFSRVPDDLGPATLSTRGLPTARRGYEKKSVDALVAISVERWAELERRYRLLMDKVEKVGGADHLVRDLTAIGDEVGRILDAANDAATALRERARDDAERVRTQAQQEADKATSEADDAVERTVADAEAAAFEVRQAAWEHGVALIDSAATRAAQLVAEAREEVLKFRSEGERESHRRVAATRKDTEDMVRAARVEAEHHIARARMVAAEILERAELGFDGDLDATERRRKAVLTDLELLEAERSIAEVTVMPAEPAPDPDSHPEPDRPVLAEHTGHKPEPDPRADFGESLMAEVEQIHRNGDESTAPEPGGREGEPRGRQPELGEIGSLFEALRSTAEHQLGPREQSGEDPLVVRDRRLMGLHNAALRDVKRRIAELQDRGIAGLEQGEWSPSQEAIGSDLTALLEPFLTRASSAGADEARQTTGVEPVIPKARRARSMVGTMAGELGSQLRAALSRGGVAADRITAMRSVLRTWRVDDAERWVAAILIAAFNDAMIASLEAGSFDRLRGLPSGVACVDCLGADGAVWELANPPANKRVPPADVNCRCGVVVSE
jgi:cell division septum initiation protein DivIVA